MNTPFAFWSRLDLRRRLVLVAATLAVFLAVLALARSVSSPSLALLYSGLDASAAGEVVQMLDRSGTPYEVRGESIWVPADRRDQLRMTLAGEGLPTGGGAGYELLDSLTGFGTTAQMFDAAYLRAKEGELARTIAASPLVRSARVHLSVTGAQPFRRPEEASASVTVTTTGGVPPALAQAIRHLVASAVAGLNPDRVAVIDAVSGLVPLPRADGAFAETRAADLKLAVERLLAARVGRGGALVELSVDLVAERESITERRFDPQGRVAVSTESEERTQSATGTPPSVTVASNLPEGDATQGNASRSQESTTRERTNFEVSETARELIRPPGTVRRITVAVLVDGQRGADGVWQPRSEAELADLRELVASTVGFDAERGDVITIKTMEFEPLPDGTAVAEAGLLQRIDLMALIQLAVAAVVILALGLFVLRPILTQSRTPPQAPLALPPLSEAGARGVPVLTGVIEDGQGRDGTVEGSGGMLNGSVPPDPVARLRARIAERQAESVEILRGWMDEREETG